MKPKALLSWSSGKDSAWALHRLRQRDEVEIIGLATTFNEIFDRVAMHSVRRELVERQAAAAQLPLWPVMLPWPCSNAEYEARMLRLIEKARGIGVTAFAFGDLFLEEIRQYRERQLQGTGLVPLFPLWCSPDDTLRLAQEMIDGGLSAVLTCVDPRRVAADFAGRTFDFRLLADLPAEVDPCGERGEFHTFCCAGPMFERNVPVTPGERLERDGFVFADLLPAIDECG
jgi:uncharacterized protein (TIGR00290 family)